MSDSYQSELAELIECMETSKSPVLCIYLFLHAVNELALCQDFQSSEPQNKHFDIVKVFLPLKSELRHQYVKCPPAFQGVPLL